MLIAIRTSRELSLMPSFVSVSNMLPLSFNRKATAASHNQCMTEAERYQGSTYVQKDSNNKGQKKQDSWLQVTNFLFCINEFSTETYFYRISKSM